MSVSREVLASVFGVDVEDVVCQKCRYGDGGELLVRCGNPFYGDDDLVVAGGGYCSFWMAERSEE